MSEKYTVPSYTYQVAAQPATSYYTFFGITVTRGSLFDYFNRETMALEIAQSHMSFPTAHSLQEWAATFTNLYTGRQFTCDYYVGDRIKRLLDDLTKWVREENKRMDIDDALAETERSRGDALYYEAMLIIEKGIK